MAVSLDSSSALSRTAEREYGLDSPAFKRINEILHDIDPRLSLRRIEPGDPAFRPPKTMGVYEEGVVQNGAVTPWVLTIEPEFVDERLIARVLAGDMSKMRPGERMEKLRQAREIAQAKIKAEWEEEKARRREEILFIASGGRNSIRHKINGEDVILSDEVRSPRTHV